MKNLAQFFLVAVGAIFSFSNFAQDAAPAAAAPAVQAPAPAAAVTNQAAAAPATNQPAATPPPAPAPVKPQPPAEQLLPAETFFVLTIKDWEQAADALKKTPGALMWGDESMKTFREKFYAKLHEDFFKGFEKEAGLQITNYLELLKGQVTLAMTAPAKEEDGPGLLVLADVKENSEKLKTRLAETVKKYTDGGSQVKRETLRGVEFTTFEIPQGTIANLLGDDEEVEDEDAAKKKTPLTIGQSGSLLVMGRQTADIEKVLARQSGGSVPALAEQGTFQKNFNALFRDGPVYAWVNFKPLYEQMIKPSPEAPQAEPGQPMGIGANLTAEKILPALGLQWLESLAVSTAFGPEGYGVNLFLTVPESARQGILKVIAPPAKEAAPPAFVPADAVKFTRMRLDFLEAWNTLEAALVKIDTATAGVVKMMMELAGKDKDPNFDLRKSLIASLGDDFISYEKAPRGTSLAELETPPSITLIGAREPEQLLNGIRVMLSLLPEPIATAQLKEREFLGRKIYYIPIMRAPAAGGTAPVEREVQFASHGGYVAISTDRGMIEEFLRGSEGGGKPLREVAGFNDAAQKVGGLNTGWFGFENSVETARAAFAALKANPTAQQGASALPVGGQGAEIAMEFFDLASLPPFERVAKYFHHGVFSVTSTPEGIAFKFNMPRPPGLN